MAGIRALCVALALASTPVAAAPASEAGGQSDVMDDAERLHREGQDRYDTADYQGAIERWTDAYGALPNTQQGAAMKPFILYNIASAHEKAFEIYGDVAQLKRARALLVKFESTIDTIYGEEAEAQAERMRVEERIAAIDALIAEREPDPSTPPPRLPPPSESNPTPVVTGPAPATGSDPRLITGAVLTTLGVGTSVLLGAGLGVGSKANDLSGVAADDLDGRESQFRRGQRGNTLAIVGAVATPLLLGAGIALIVLAKKRSRSPGRDATLRAPGARRPAMLSLRF